MIRFLIECLAATLYIAFENLQVMYLCQLKKESQINKQKKNWDFFFCNLETCSQIPLSKQEQGCIFFTVYRTVFSQCINLFAITLLSTALHPFLAWFQPRQCQQHTDVLVVDE